MLRLALLRAEARRVCWDGAVQSFMAAMQPVVRSSETLNGGADNQPCRMHHGVLMFWSDAWISAFLCELLSVRDSNTVRILNSLN